MNMSALEIVHVCTYMQRGKKKDHDKDANGIGDDNNDNNKHSAMYRIRDIQRQTQNKLDSEKCEYCNPVPLKSTGIVGCFGVLRWSEGVGRNGRKLAWLFGVFILGILKLGPGLGYWSAGLESRHPDLVGIQVATLHGTESGEENKYDKPIEKENKEQKKHS